MAADEFHLTDPDCERPTKAPVRGVERVLKLRNEWRTERMGIAKAASTREDQG
jgi:hypothetical protein